MADRRAGLVMRINSAGALTSETYPSGRVVQPHTTERTGSGDPGRSGGDPGEIREIRDKPPQLLTLEQRRPKKRSAVNRESRATTPGTGLRTSAHSDYRASRPLFLSLFFL